MFNSDKAICIFPAGLVSRKQQGVIKDLEWKRTFVTYAKTTGHPIIPIHIEGKLSRFFYGLHRLRTWLGIKTTLEMLYLADELYKQRARKSFLPWAIRFFYRTMKKTKMNNASLKK
jgi:putative hemolysin